MPVITFASSKGGAGRTTAAIILATTLARKNTVILIDADPDHRLMSWSTKASLPGRLTVLKSKGAQDIAAEIGAAETRADFVIVDLDDSPIGLDPHAVEESDLVIIPMGDEHPDAEATLETQAQLVQREKILGREIPVRVLFTRTGERAAKSKLAHSINTQIRDKVEALFTELHDRTAYSSLHNRGGTLYDMDPEDMAGLAQAIANAEVVAEEVIRALARAGRRPAQTVQMSVRMKVDVYDAFRALCRAERRTNGDMLEVLMGKFLEREQGDVQP